jgi:hypothetical protein
MDMAATVAQPPARSAILGWIAAAALPLLAMGLPVAFGDATFLLHRESVDQTWGWMQKLAQAWHDGYLPLWNASTQAGHSFAGEIQPGVFYPLHWLWLALFERDGAVALGAIEALVLLHFAIASLGMYGLLRHWRLSPAAALGGALCFALTGPVAMRAIAQANIFYAIAWLPWTLWAAARFLDRGRRRDGLATGALLGLQVVAGHVQPALHAAILVAAMVLIGSRARHGGWKPAWRDAIRLGLLALPGVLLLAGPQFLLTAEYAQHAYRWMGADVPVGPGDRMRYAVFAHQYIIAPRDFLAFVDPWRFLPPDANGLWIGTLPLLLAAWFLADRARRDSVTAWRDHQPWLLAVAVFALLAMLGHFSFLAAVLRPLPGGTMIRQLARHALLLHVVLVIAFACALQALADGARLPRPPRWLWIVGGLQLVWLLFADPALLSRPAAWHLAAALAAFALAALWPAQRALVLAACFGVLAFHVVHGTGHSVPQPLAGRTPRPLGETAPSPVFATAAAGWGRYRVLVDEGAGLPRNIALVQRMQSRDGYGASMHVATHDFFSQDWAYDGRIADLLNIRWVIGAPGLPLREVVRDEARGLVLYERARWLPRVFLRHQQDGEGPAIEAELGLEVVEYGDHVQRFRFNAARADDAIVAELDYPGWCAWVNGEAAPIRPAALPGLKPWHRAVAVPAGPVELTFRYRPFRSRIAGCGAG